MYKNQKQFEEYQKNMQWMNRNIRKSVKKKYNLYKRYLRTRSDEDYKIYAKFRNSCGKLIKQGFRPGEHIPPVLFIVADNRQQKCM